MHLQSLPNELLKWTTHHLNPREYMRLHRTCKLMYSNRKPYNFQVPTQKLDRFLRKAPLEVFESMQIAEWTEEAIVTAFVRGLPVCQKLIESGQVSDKKYYVYNSDMPHYFGHLWSGGDGSEATLLSICAMHGHTQLIELLLDHGFHINQRESNGLTPLTCAIGAHQADACRLLMERGEAIANNDDSRPLVYLAAEYGTPEILQMLVTAGQDVNLVHINQTPLHAAARCGTVENVQWLLQHGADLWMRADNRSVLETSLEYKNSAVFDHLLQRYLESDPPEYWKEDALAVAAGERNFKACQKLLDLGANVNGNPNFSETPLYWCLYGSRSGANQHGVYKLLLEHGAELYVGDPSKECALIEASRSNLTDAMEQLIEKDPRIVQWACREGYFGALHAAAGGGYVTACQILLKYGADINVTNEEGRTPLIFSTYRHSRRTRKFLMESGADLQIRDNHGWSVMTYAIYNRDKPFIQLLRERGMQLPAQIPDTTIYGALVTGQELIDWLHENITD
ncbi:ankyrin repeat-containing domain protein [Gorgonomyces haynaldii]|nr:ankyrin repeat-containing domain protein [Gorgonomyces haynaldii]